MKPLFVFIVFLTLLGCKNISEEKSDLPILEDNTPKKELVTEIFTRTYSVKKENGLIVKDSVRKIESIIVNADGRELGKNLYATDGSLFNTEVYNYNEDGHKTDANFFRGGDQLEGHLKYDLDDQGRPVQQQMFFKGNKDEFMKSVFRYLDDGKIKQQGIITDEGDFIPTHEFLFDENGLELGYNVFEPYTTNKMFYVFKYTKHDEGGLWIERQALKEGEVIAVFVRNFVNKEI